MKQKADTQRVATITDARSDGTLLFEVKIPRSAFTLTPPLPALVSQKNVEQVMGMPAREFMRTIRQPGFDVPITKDGHLRLVGREEFKAWLARCAGVPVMAVAKPTAWDISEGTSCPHAEALRALHGLSLPRDGAGVYFILVGEFVKIGVSENVRERFNRLSGAFPIEPRLMLIEPGDARREEAFHARFGSVRVRREWFHARGALAQFIVERRLDADAGRPDPFDVARWGDT